MKKYNILICIFSRANYGRLRSVLKFFKISDRINLQVMVGASFSGERIPYNIDSNIQCLISGDDLEAMATTTGIALTKIPMELKRLKPDLVLVHGDRYEMLAVAIASSYMNIPLAHTEGGEISGTIDNKVRYAISSLADLHFPVTRKAQQRLISNKNLNIDSVIPVGSTAFDLISPPKKRKLSQIVVLFHSDTTQKENLSELLDAIDELSNKYRIIWVNPNVDAGSKDILKEFHKKKKFEFRKNLSVDEYLGLIANSKCLIGNTSSGIKEGSFLGVKYICVGTRQLNREVDNNTIFASMTKKDILRAFNLMMVRNVKPSEYFGNGRSASYIGLEILKALDGGTL